MRFCAVSDLHGNISLVPRITLYAKKLRCKFIVFCGDLTDFGTVNEGIEVLKTFSKSGLKTLYVPSNCDPPPRNLLTLRLKVPYVFMVN